MSNATRIVAATAGALALAAPASQARPAVEAPNHNSPASIAEPPTPVTTGFDWGDAAVGGGAVFALVALFSAGAAVAVRARTAPTR